LEPLGRDSRVLESLPGKLEHEPLLRVHRGGLARRDAEEAGIEAIGSLEIAAAAQSARRLIGPGEPVELPPLAWGIDDRLAALAEELPVRGGARRARQATRHADHRNGVAIDPQPLRTVVIHSSHYVAPASTRCVVDGGPARVSRKRAQGAAEGVPRSRPRPHPRPTPPRAARAALRRPRRRVPAVER